jgi:hypothetical protein
MLDDDQSLSTAGLPEKLDLYQKLETRRRLALPSTAIKNIAAHSTKGCKGGQRTTKSVEILTIR